MTLTLTLTLTLVLHTCTHIVRFFLFYSKWCMSEESPKVWRWCLAGSPWLAIDTLTVCLLFCFLPVGAVIKIFSHTKRVFLCLPSFFKAVSFCKGGRNVNWASISFFLFCSRFWNRGHFIRTEWYFLLARWQPGRCRRSHTAAAFWLEIKIQLFVSLQV